MHNSYQGLERRAFERLEHVKPLDYKICNKKIISKLLQGYTSNVSQAGLLCNIKEKVEKGDILWLSFDRDTLGFYEELERRALIYQNGIISKVVRVTHKKDNSFDVGVHFITRKEKDLTPIYLKKHFLWYRKV